MEQGRPAAPEFVIIHGQSMVPWFDDPGSASLCRAWLKAMARSSIGKLLPIPPYVESATVHGKEMSLNLEDTSNMPTMVELPTGLISSDVRSHRWHDRREGHATGGGGAACTNGARFLHYFGNVPYWMQARRGETQPS